MRTAIRAKEAVPEFFHRMAADDHGTLKCRIVLEAVWEADGTVDGERVREALVVRHARRDLRRGATAWRCLVLSAPASR